MDTVVLPKRLEFRRVARIPQFIRAVLVLLVGAGIFIAALDLRRFLALPPNSPVETVLRWGGGFIAFSGLLALVLLIIALARHQGQVIEVDETGLTVHREGKNRQSLQWAEVSNYEVQESSLINPSDFATSNSSPLTHSSQGTDDLFGCLFGLVFGLYFTILEWFVRGSAWKVKFKLKSRRVLVVSGYGREMDDLIDHLLPRFLPDKRKLPQAVKQEKDDAPQN